MRCKKEDAIPVKYFRRDPVISSEEQGGRGSETACQSLLRPGDPRRGSKPRPSARLYQAKESEPQSESFAIDWLCWGPPVVAGFDQ